MKRILLLVSIFFSFCVPAVVSSGLAVAVNVVPACNSAASNTDVCKDVSDQGGNNGGNNPIIDIIKGAINILSYIIGVAAVIGIIVSSIRLMTTGGDSSAVASARSALIYSLIGIAVVVLAQTLVALVLDKL